MSIPGSASPLFIGAAAADAAAFQIDRSLRFNSADSAYLNRTPSSAGNRKTWTWSGWVKRCQFSTLDGLFFQDTGTDDTNYGGIFFNTDGTLAFNGWSTVFRRTSAVYRDPGAWMHIVVACNTTLSDADSRMRFYVNGAEITDWTTKNTITQNADLSINKASEHRIGRVATAYANQYLTEVNFVDGQALAASDFAEYDDNNVWQPKQYSGTYGTNGFKLDFSDNTSTTTISEDSSGNNNDWTANNISVASDAGNDSLIDTPTNYTADSGNNGGNYATWNPLQKYAAITLSNGNLDFTDSNSVNGGDQGVHATIAPLSGKFYWEMTLSTLASENYIGISKKDKLTQTLWTGGGVDGYYYYNNGNKIGGGNGNGGQAYGASFGVGDVIGVAVDWDNGKVTFYKNGASQGDAFTGKDLTGYIPAYYFNTNQSSAGVVNFGQRPFAYTPPTGYVSLCTQNLPDPTIADGSTAFDAKLYTGNGSTQTISGLGFSPDLVWLKVRNTTYSHYLSDTVRGATKEFYTNATNAEGTDANGLTGFTSDGFTLGTDTGRNESGKTYVGWAWDGGTSTVSNTDGSITSSVRANASAGFSIVSWSGTSANATVGHGLNAAPEFIITKVRGMTSNWYCYHTGLTDATKYIWLNSTAAEGTQTAAWNSTAPTSSVIHVGGEAEVNRNGYNTIAYCFSPVAGYSAFGSYTGNSSSDGPFVYTGFAPRWVLFKRTDTSGDSWTLFDTARDTNPLNVGLEPNSSAAEQTYGNRQIDTKANGFKVTSTGASSNASGGTYIYAAFAEHPFKTARAR